MMMGQNNGRTLQKMSLTTQRTKWWDKDKWTKCQKEDRYLWPCRKSSPLRGLRVKKELSFCLWLDCLFECIISSFVICSFDKSLESASSREEETGLSMRHQRIEEVPLLVEYERS